MSKKYDHPVYEHPETGKVLNPATGNWVQQSYARKIGVLSDAKQKTAEHFRQQEEKAQEAAKKAAKHLKNAEEDDEREVISSAQNRDSEKEQLDETARVEYDDETGQEHRVDHGDSAKEKTPDEALDNIMSDIDSGKDFEGDDFVDKDAAEPTPGADAPVDPKDTPGVPEDEDVEDYNPENVEIPTFPGGIYSTKSQKEKKKRKQIEEMSEGDDPRNRSDTRKAGEGKRY
jgi:hypothetical protein